MPMGGGPWPCTGPRAGPSASEESVGRGRERWRCPGFRSPRVPAMSPPCLQCATEVAAVATVRVQRRDSGHVRLLRGMCPESKECKRMTDDSAVPRKERPPVSFGGHF